MAYQTYFTGSSVTGIESILESGIRLDKFLEYIEEFTSYKKVSDGSDGSMDSGTFGLVGGINSDNKIVECVSLTEMARELKIELSPKNSPNYSPGVKKRLKRDMIPIPWLAGNSSKSIKLSNEPDQNEL